MIRIREGRRTEVEEEDYYIPVANNKETKMMMLKGEEGIGDNNAYSCG